MAEFEPLWGFEMDDEEIEELLKDIGIGVLSMSVEGIPYGVPLSFGYNGDDKLYFVFLGESTELRKETYAERTSVASFTTFAVEPDGSWRSVIVAGPLDRITVDELDTAREAMANNAYQPNLFSEFEFDENPNVRALKIQDRSGRAVGQ